MRLAVRARASERASEGREEGGRECAGGRACASEGESERGGEGAGKGDELKGPLCLVEDYPFAVGAAPGRYVGPSLKT